MEALKKRYIRAGTEFDHLFPSAMAGTETIVRDAGLSDTVAFIPKVVANTLDHTVGISEKLKGRDVYDTCRNIWHFVYQHIAYRKDRDGYEQIRSPARAWADRHKGVDCDCYSTFISSILTNLSIPHRLRITKYKKNYFQHIYPVVPYGSRYITLDCVTDRFDYEVPYTEKKDINMELQYLNGWDGLDDLDERGSDVVFDGSEMGELGLFGRRKRKKAEAAAAAQPLDPNAVPPSGVKKKRGLKKLFSKVNKINPLTVLLRNGVLAAMKLNLFKIAGRLRWTYLSPNAAKAKGIDPEKFKKLVAVRQRLENTFDGAGGKVDNLRKAILKGKGNKDKAVAVFGLGFLPEDEAIGYMDINTPLDQLLGPDIYHSENVEGMGDFQGFGALGEPVTGATIAAATAVLTAIAKLLKGVGNIFGKGQKGSEDFDENAVAASDAETTAALPTTTTAPILRSSGASSASSYSEPGESASYDDGSYEDAGGGMGAETALTTVQDQSPAIAAAAVAAGNNSPPSATESFWQKNKKWLLPTAIGVGGIALIVAMKMLKSSPARTQAMGSLNGAPRKGKRRKKKSAGKKNAHAPITPVALL